MGRPLGVKNGEGKTRDMADSTNFSIRMQRLQTLDDVQDALSNGMACTYCQADLLHHPMMSIQKDHMIAFDDGGATAAGNLISACRTCNYSKGKRMTSIQFAYIVSAKHADPDSHLATIKASIRRQLTTPVSATMGTLAYAAWRYWTADMTTDDERREIPLHMILSKMLEMAGELKAAA